jgi:hypothetical protein
MVTDLLTRKTFPPPVAEIPQTNRGWVVVVSGIAYTPLTLCLLPAYNTAYIAAYNKPTEKTGSRTIPNFWSAICPNAALQPGPSCWFLSFCSKKLFLELLAIKLIDKGYKNGR